MFDTAIDIIKDAEQIVVIQAENPDADSIGSALALEEILSDAGKSVTLYCPVDIPRYLRYISGWDRIIAEFPLSSDVAIIVDTAAEVLLSKVLETRGVRHYLESHPTIIIDHHESEPTLQFDYTLLSYPAIATSHVIFDFASAANWNINKQAAEDLMIALLGDSLGFTTPNVTPESFRVAAELTARGASTAVIEDRRRQYMKKSQEILAYKGELISRVAYHLDGRLAVVHVPFEEIERYSDQYNPGALIGDELRLVENVDVSCVIKTYPDGKLTGRLRSNIPVAEQVAGFFGGGGHAYAAGFRIYEDIDQTLHELIKATDDILTEYDTTT